MRKWGNSSGRRPNRANTFGGIQQSKKKLVATLDRWFSLYIRLSNSFGSGYCCCITCGTPKHYTEIDNGHFMDRDKMNTRWDERNCNPQCPACNRFKNGKQFEHGLAIDRKHGEGVAEELLKLSKIPRPWSKHELEGLIVKYKTLVKGLK